jgi:hypothetical protein
MWGDAVEAAGEERPGPGSRPTAPALQRDPLAGCAIRHQHVRSP